MCTVNKSVCASHGGKTRLTGLKSERHPLPREDCISGWVIKVFKSIQKRPITVSLLWAVFFIGKETNISVVQHLDSVAVSRTRETHRGSAEFGLNWT